MQTFKEMLNMNFTFLGTSHGVPSEIRYTSSYMLEIGENIYIFDAGAPVADLLLRKDKPLTSVKALFNSHFHGDHIYGGLQLISLCNWYYKTAETEVYLPHPEFVKFFSDILEATDGEISPRIKINSFAEGVIFDDGIIKVSAIPTMHNYNEKYGKNAYAFLIEAEGKSILFTGDMSSDLASNDFPQIAYERHIDMIVSECAHFPVSKLEECMAKVNTDIFAVSHIHPVAEKIPQLEALAGKYDFELLIVEDDDEVEF